MLLIIFPPPIPPSKRPSTTPPSTPDKRPPPPPLRLIKPMICRCVCINGKKQRICEVTDEENQTRGVPGLISRNGIAPNAVILVDYQQYVQNEAHEREVTEGGGCKATGFPDDALYPSHPQSDCLAMTPVYRNGQQAFIDIINAYSDHSPDGLPGTTWHEWDGTTIFPAYSLTSLSDADKVQYRKDWYMFLFPGFPDDFVIRGLKQLYDSNLPFADPSKPTVSEFENWNDKVLNHFRTLSGLPPAIMSRDLFKMCAWSRERKRTTIWDSYTGTIDSAYGPCYLPPSGNLHCGTTFKPSYGDQKPYDNTYFCGYPCSKDPPEVTLDQGSESITVWYNGNATLAMSRNLRKLFESVYITGSAIGGHAGTYARRSTYGLAVDRAKWAGDLFSPPTGYSF